MEQQIYLNRSFSEPDIYSHSTYCKRMEVEEYRLQSKLQDCGKPEITEIRKYSYVQQTLPLELGASRTRLVVDRGISRSAILFEHKSTSTSPYIQTTRNIKYEERLCANPLGFCGFRANPTCNIILSNNVERHKPDKMEQYIENEDVPMDIDNYDTSSDEHDECSSGQNYTELGECIDHGRKIVDDTIIKPRELNKKPKPSRRNQHRVRRTILGAILVIILAWSYHLIYIETPLPPKPKTGIDLTLDKILYQDHVKDITVKSFNELQNSTIVQKKILVFVGTTGVGKTYTVNLIRQHFPKEFVIGVNILLESHLILDNIKASMKSNGCYFITIDDLQIENLETVLSFIENLPDKCALIVPIFNIHNVDDHFVYTVNKNHFKNIKEEFTNKFSPNADIVLFNDINRNVLEIWLTDQIKEKGLDDKKNIIFSLLDEHDVKIYGFKGLSAKINVLGS